MPSKINNLVLTSALGIAVGDRLTTSYSDTPYEVVSLTPPRKFHISPMHVVIRDFAVISLVLKDLRDGFHNSESYINNIRRAGESLWLTDQNDRILVEKSPVRKTGVQLTIFDALMNQAERKDDAENVPDYPFQPGVDYARGTGKVWHCGECERDFNTIEKPPVVRSLPCPYCAYPLSAAVYLMKQPPLGDLRRYPSEYTLTLNFWDYKPNAELRKSHLSALTNSIS
jgi:DNA-directed RNA polymerase subunit RPC12/RpoP